MIKKRIIVSYLLTLGLLALLDWLWISVIAEQFINKQIGHILRISILWPPAVAWYLLYPVGLILFALVPALEKESPAQAILYGGLFGLFSYATYALTNYATLTGWPLAMVTVDILWGTIVSGTIMGIVFAVGKKIQ